ncbi:hypothetical protein [Streptococcus equinus]|uniref:hypothetical protein n=1 Tax=Streptococcus equinus TaxID=1335 RepID=UPI003BF88483
MGILQSIAILLFLGSLLSFVVALVVLFWSLVRKNKELRKQSLIGILISLLVFFFSVAIYPNKDGSDSSNEKAKTEQTSSKSAYSSSSSSSYSYSSSSSSASYSYSSSSEPFDPNNYEVPDFAAWNHDQLENDKKVQVTGTVVQNTEDDGYHFLRVAIDGDYDKIIMAGITNYVYDDIIAEDDNVTFYGISKGLTSYESTFRKTVTLPLMSVDCYNINSYGN